MHTSCVIDHPPVTDHAIILVVSNSKEVIANIERVVRLIGFAPMVADTAEQALELYKNECIAYVLMDVDLVDCASDVLIRSMREHTGDRYIPIIVMATISVEEQLSCCQSAGCDDLLFKPFCTDSLQARLVSLDQIRDLKYLYEDSVNEQMVAKRILNSALEERSIQLDEIGLLNKSKSVFSGDLFLTARCSDGSLNILLADFTGHGLSAAIGALPVADVFSVMTAKGFDLDYILENINRKLHTLLPASMFMACSVVNIARDLKHVKVWNGGMPDIYIRDCITGDVKHRIKSSHIPLGIDEAIMYRFELEIIELSVGDQLILYTDGLTDALNVDHEMFGDAELEQCFQDNNKERSIFTKLVDTFTEFCGDIDPMDDVTLACIPCVTSLMCAGEESEIKKASSATEIGGNNWCWYMELGGGSLRELNPVPIVISEIKKMSSSSASTDILLRVMSAIYQNAIDYDSPDNDSHEISHVDTDATKKINRVSSVYVQIGIKKVKRDGVSALFVQMEGSGKEVSADKYKDFMGSENKGTASTSLDEMSLVYELNQSSDNQGSANHFEAYVFDC